MARKINDLKALLGASKPAAADNRQPMPSTTAPYLAQLRSHSLKTPPPELRQQIAIQIEEPQQAPSMVEIIHTNSN
jgi:hypothetical protein